MKGSRITERAISPLRDGDEVDVIGLAPVEECGREMFVMIRWEKREGLGVPLSQIQFVHESVNTKQAVEDWQYWVKRGYEFG